MRQIKKGSTDQSIVIRIVDSGDGTPETGVAYNTSGIDLWYRREGAAKTSITEATLSALTDAHSDGGVLHIGDGYYRLDLPDAAVASGANGVMVGGTVTGMVVIGCYIHLVDYDPQDPVRLGLTALPNAAAAASGGLPTVGTSSGQIALSSGNVAAVLAAGVVHGGMETKLHLEMEAGPAVIIKTTTSGEAIDIDSASYGVTIFAAQEGLSIFSAGAAGIYAGGTVGMQLVGTSGPDIDLAGSGEINGVVDANVVAINNSTDAAERAAQFWSKVRQIIVDDATFSPTTTAFETDQTTDDADRYSEQVLYGLDGDNAAYTVRITGYAFTNSKVKLTVDTLPAAPSNGHRFLLMGRIEQ